MLKKGLSLLLAAVTLLTAAGCGSVFEDEYYYEEAFSGDVGTVSGNATEISNFSMLKTAMTGMISRREERRDFRLNNYHGNPSEDLAAACYEIKSSNPLGAYAVETMSYETNYVVSYYIATVYITYKRSFQEITSVRYAVSPAEFDGYVLEAADSFTPETVARIYSAHVDEDYIRRLVKQHYYDDPLSQVREPVVTVDSYPVEGANRIYDLHLDFGIPESLIVPICKETENAVNAAVRSVKDSLEDADSAHLALAAADFLSRMCAGGSGTGSFADTVYGVLMCHDADSKGLALAYRALCAGLELPCFVVEGSRGTMGGEAHYWNIIELDGAYYHVDVSAFSEDAESAFLLRDEELWGTYLWTAEDYPACDGPLRYASLFPPEEEDTETEDAEEAVSGEEAENAEEPSEQEPDDPPEEGSEPQPGEEENEEKNEKTP